MEVQKDFRDLLELFNAHKVDYLVVGAYALAFHGAPRYTGGRNVPRKPRLVGGVKGHNIDETSFPGSPLCGREAS
jgi:hypothetical protein